jgi:hypothetical protein
MVIHVCLMCCYSCVFDSPARERDEVGAPASTWLILWMIMDCCGLWLILWICG